MGLRPHVMIVLGLDPSLTGFGWAVHNSNVVGPSRVLAKGQFITDANALFIERYAAIRDALITLIGQYPIEAVGVESPPYGESFSEGLYGLFLYVNEALHLCRKDVVYFDPTTLKMLAKMDPNVRRGTMDKGDMVEAAKSDTQIKKWHHNEADAYLIARSAARFWKRESQLITDEDLTPSELRSFARVHTYQKGAKAGRTVKAGLIFREDDRFFRYSKIPPIPEEEELVKWLSARNHQKALKIKVLK